MTLRAHPSNYIPLENRVLTHLTVDTKVIPALHVAIAECVAQQVLFVLQSALHVLTLEMQETLHDGDAIGDLQMHLLRQRRALPAVQIRLGAMVPGSTPLGA